MKRGKTSDMLNKIDKSANDGTPIRQNLKRKLVNNDDDVGANDEVAEKRKFYTNTRKFSNDSMQNLESEDLSQDNVKSANGGADKLNPVGLNEENKLDNNTENIDDNSLQSLESKDSSQENVESVNDGIAKETTTGLERENKLDNNTENIDDNSLETLESKDLSQENVESANDGVAIETTAGLEGENKLDNSTENIDDNSLQTLESKDSSQENVESVNDGVAKETTAGLEGENKLDNSTENIDGSSLQTLGSKDLSQKNVESANGRVTKVATAGLEGENNKQCNNTENIPNDSMQTLKNSSQKNVESTNGGVDELTSVGLREKNILNSNTENIDNGSMQNLGSKDLSQENVKSADDEIRKLTAVEPKECVNNTNNVQSNNNTSRLEQTSKSKDSSVQLMSPLQVYEYLRNSETLSSVADKSKVRKITKKFIKKKLRTQKRKHKKKLNQSKIQPSPNLQQDTQFLSQSQEFEVPNCLGNSSYHLNNTNGASVARIEGYNSEIISNYVVPVDFSNGIESSFTDITTMNNAIDFHTSNDSDSAKFICSNLTMAIVEKNPCIHPTNINLEILKILINRQIDQIPDGMRLPKFNDSTVKDGFLLITAAEKFSRKWLRDIVPKLKLEPNVTLRAIPVHELKQFYESKIFINDENDVDIVLNRLRRQNLDVNMAGWNLYSVEKLPNGEVGMVLNLEIPSASVELLRAKQFKLFYGIERINVHTKTISSLC